MQDFCFKCVSKEALLSALEAAGVPTTGDLLYAGRVMATPGVSDPETGTEITAPTYLDGEYAVFRATDQVAAVIEAATLPEGVEVIDPPGGLPRFGGLWLTPDLDVLKATACARIDTMAEALRNTVLTPGSGQMAAYQAKEAQAAAYLQDGDPTEAEYPDLYNEVGITADTAHEVAMAVLAAAEKWRIFGRTIERARLAGKKAVNEATNLSGVKAAEAAVAWPAG